MHEEDLKWCANLLIGCGFVFAFAGVIFAAYLPTESRCWVMIASSLIGLAFAVGGMVCHWIVYQQIKRITIKHWKDVENGKVPTLWRGPGPGGDIGGNNGGRNRSR